jgi:hypothetical protein
VNLHGKRVVPRQSVGGDRVGLRRLRIISDGPLSYRLLSGGYCPARTRPRSTVPEPGVQAPTGLPGRAGPFALPQPYRRTRGPGRSLGGGPQRGHRSGDDGGLRKVRNAQGFCDIHCAPRPVPDRRVPLGQQTSPVCKHFFGLHCTEFFWLHGQAGGACGEGVRAPVARRYLAPLRSGGSAGPGGCVRRDVRRWPARRPVRTGGARGLRCSTRRPRPGGGGLRAAAR